MRKRDQAIFDQEKAKKNQDQIGNGLNIIHAIENMSGFFSSNTNLDPLTLDVSLFKEENSKELKSINI